MHANSKRELNVDRHAYKNTTPQRTVLFLAFLHEFPEQSQFSRFYLGRVSASSDPVGGGCGS